MEHERNVQEIRHQLVVVAEIVENGGVSTKMQEVFVADLLGKSRDWVAGQPVPNRQANEPGVDLKFPKEGTAVQVTKERSRRKVEETLAVCERHLDAKEYTKVVLFYTGRSGGKKTRATVKSPTGTWTVRIPEDTWDYETIIDDVIQHPDKAKTVLTVVRDFVGRCGTALCLGEVRDIDSLQIPATSIERDVQGRIEEELRDNGEVWVYGPLGAGKTRVVEMALRKLFKGSTAKVYETKDLESDQVRSMVETATRADEEIIWVEDLETSGSATTRSRVRELAQRCREAEKKLVITSYDPPWAEWKGGKEGSGRAVRIGHANQGEIERLAKEGHGLEEGVPWPFSGVEEHNTTLVDKFFVDITNSGPKDVWKAFVTGSERQRAQEGRAQQAVDALNPADLKALAALAVSGGEFTRTEAKKVTGLDVTGSEIRRFRALEGRWIERKAGDTVSLEVSALLAKLPGLGLDEHEREQVHRKWARVQVDRAWDGTVNLDQMILHALAGKSERELNLVSMWVLTTEPGQAQEWRSASLILRMRLEDCPRQWMSEVGFWLWRIAMLKLTHPNETYRRRKLIQSVSDSIESTQASGKEFALLLTLISGFTILNLEEWETIDLDITWWALQIDEAQRQAEKIEKYDIGLQTSEAMATAGLLMFSSYLTIRADINTLVRVVGELDDKEEARKSLLREDTELESWLYTAIHAPWLKAKEDKEKLKALIPGYEAVTDKTAGWEDERVHVHARVAISVIENEYMASPTNALRALDMEPRTPEGYARLLVARAKVAEWRGNWKEAAKLRQVARALTWDQNPTSRRVTRREDAIAEARAGDYATATALFREASQIASDEGRASASRALDNTHLPDLARALELDAAITQALNEEMGKAILTLDRLASDLLTNPAGQSKAGKRLTNMIGHVALWLNLRSEGWQAAEIDSQAGIVPGVASLEHWPEDSKVTPRIGAEDRYWAAKYLAAIALIRLNGSDRLARAVEGSRKFALAFETLMAYERRNLAIIQYDGQSLWRHAAELEGLLRQALENPGQESLRAERRIEPESGLQPGAAQVEGILRTCAIRETLEGQSSDTGSEGLEKTRSLYEEGRKYCGRLGWLEAMLSATATLQDLQRREDILLYRTLNAIEKDTRMGGAQGTQYETWKWATILWLFSHSTDGGTLIREALASWLEVRRTWERPRGSREQTAQRLAALLWKMMKDNPSWGRDADDGAKAQLEAAAGKTAQLPKFGDE